MKSLTDTIKRAKKQPQSSRHRSQFTSVRDKDLGRKGEKQKNLLFKRGRTMPGSTRTGITSADTHALRSATPREKVNHLSHLRRIIMTVLGVVVAGSIVLFITVWQFSATIHVGSSQDIRTQSLQYTKTIQTYLNQHPMERLRFNLHSATLTQFVQESHPEVAAVDQDGNDGFATTLYTFTLRQPVVRWDVAGTRYYVDADGVSFEKNYFSEPSVRIIDKSGVHYTPGTAIASERFLSFVGRMVSLSAAKSLKVTEVVIPTGTTRQAELRIKGVAYPVIVSIERGPAEQVEDMKKSISYMRTHHKHPRYIDIRVKGKAFYRE